MKTTALTFFLLAACGAAAKTPSGDVVGGNTDSALQSALESTDGGLSDDPSALSATETEDADATAAGTSLDDKDASPPVADPTAPNDSEPKMPTGFLTKYPNGKAFFVRLAWGNFPHNPAGAGVPVTYTGTVAASGAILRHVRSWHFEHNDGIVRPRTDKASIAFDSTITTASDGLHFFVLSPEGTGNVTITLGAQFTKTLDLSTLDRVREQDDAATSGQHVRVLVDEIGKRSLSCSAGSLQGRWLSKTTKDGRPVARLIGRVLDETGTAEARVVGIAGERKNGKNVMFLRVFKTGALVARARGTFDPAAKTFQASVVGPLARTNIGGTKGTYAESTDAAGGTFEGSWQIGINCPDKTEADSTAQPE